jgi:predicted nucleic acid-binding protein
MFFVDTNILVYSIDRSDPHKMSAEDLLLQPLIEQKRVTISMQVLAELTSVLTRKRKTSPQATLAVIAHFASRCQLLGYDINLIEAATTLTETHRLSFWDAMILQSAVSGGCKYLLTEDFSPGTVMTVGSASVEIINPFTHQARVHALLTVG